MRARVLAAACAALLAAPATAAADLAVPDDAALAIAGTAAHPIWSGNGIGDVNGDGAADVALSRPGSVDVVLGDPGFSPVDLDDLGARGFRIDLTGGPLGSYAASLAAAGDVNGDGLGDIVLGVPSDGAYVIYGKRDAAGVDAAALGAGGIVVHGPPPEQAFPERVYRDTGADVSSAGDFNGDGYDDVAIAAPGYETSGATYVVLGGPRAGTVDLADPGGRALALSVAGWSLAAAGDRDGDGRDELVLGGARGGVDVVPDASRGAFAAVVHGVAGASAETGEQQAAVEARLAERLASSDVNTAGVVGPYGSASGPPFVARVGDFDGDGVDDFAVDVDAVEGRRFAWVVRGATERGSVLDVDAPGAAVALDGPPVFSFDPPHYHPVARAGGDVDGDGEADAVVSVVAASEEPGAFDASAWVVRGTRQPPASVDLLGDYDGLRIAGLAAEGSSWSESSGGAIGDVDGDGREELLVVTGGDAYLVRGR